MTNPMNKPTEGTYYRHYKGGVYRVQGMALNTESLDDLVIYQAVGSVKSRGTFREINYGGTLWARSLFIWNKEVILDTGEKVPRFELIEDFDSMDIEEIYKIFPLLKPLEEME